MNIVQPYSTEQITNFIDSPNHEYIRNMLGYGGWIGLSLVLYIYRNEQTNLQKIWIILASPLLGGFTLILIDFITVLLWNCLNIVFYSMILSNAFNYIIFLSFIYFIIQICIDLVENFNRLYAYNRYNGVDNAEEYMEVEHTEDYEDSEEHTEVEDAEEHTEVEEDTEVEDAEEDTEVEDSEEHTEVEDAKDSEDADLQT
jgi:hypothetical protein